MLKKIAITIILLSLFFAGSMIAQERYTLDIYLTVHAAYDGNTVEVGYMDIEGNVYPSEIFLVNAGMNQLFHVQIDVWFPPDPAPDKVYAEGWGPFSVYDYDECASNFYYPMELELWLVPGYIDPTIPQEE